MRYRENKPEDLMRARVAVAAWRDQHPQGTAEQLVQDLGGQFHRDYGVVLRGMAAAELRRRTSPPPEIPPDPTAAAGAPR